MRKSKAYKIAIRAILIAIILIQSMTPFLGYIPLGVLNVTIIHITVIVAAIVLGPNDGALIGFIWGLGSLIRAYAAPSSILDTIVFTNPVISVLPRILVGYFAGWVYRWLSNKIKSKTPAMVAAAAVGALTNTLLVLGLMRILYSSAMAASYKVPVKGLNWAIMGVVGSNGVPELLAAVIIVPIISLAIFKANKFLER